MRKIPKWIFKLFFFPHKCFSSLIFTKTEKAEYISTVNVLVFFKICFHYGEVLKNLYCLNNKYNTKCFSFNFNYT